ncbi:MAG: asparagine synthase (glutamine-hydrolyzing) [Phycisphaerales bacterium]|nr:asparagine synthase (glutamine-hydrolyzing) [Phycisphaerales bacterium]
MCGIAGLVDAAVRVDNETLAAQVIAMRDRLAHRGPDDAGVLVEADLRLALGHRRLTIVDLTETGNQPMTSACGRFTIVYNGEIYNAADLRAKYPHIRWRGRSDTEALLEHLAAKGPEGIADLNGMFAFALLDRAKGELILARDRFGQKPLCYTAGGGGRFAFASELSALRTLPWFNASIDREALAAYLLLQYVHQPRSIHAGARKLPPGCWMRVRLDEQITVEEPRRWFDWSARPEGEEPATERGIEEMLDELDALLMQAVRRRLMSDVPLGVLLSGGIDSALIASAMVCLVDDPVRSFSIGFSGSEESEHLEARQAAATIGTLHQDEVLRAEILELLPTIAAHLDEPLGDSSCLPTFLLAQLARRDVKVVLTGDGGDELFGGYQRYAETLREEAQLAHRLRYVATQRRRWSAADAYCSPRFWMFMPETIIDWIGDWPEFAAHGAATMRGILADESRPLIHRMRDVDVHTYLPGAVLAKVDRMTMAHGLEARSPFLDPEVAAFASRLPASLSGSAVRLKPMLRDVLARRLPREWSQRPKKGFGLPSSAWSHAKMIGLCDELLLAPDARCRDLLDRQALAAWVHRQRRPQAFSVYQVWTLLVLELWLRSAVDVAASGAAAGPLCALPLATDC